MLLQRDQEGTTKAAQVTVNVEWREDKSGLRYVSSLAKGLFHGPFTLSLLPSLFLAFFRSFSPSFFLSISFTYNRSISVSWNTYSIIIQQKGFSPSVLFLSIQYKQTEQHLDP